MGLVRFTYVNACFCSFLLSGFIYPVVVHLMWSSDGLLSPYTYRKILGGDGYIDLAGATVVHVTGGVSYNRRLLLPFNVTVFLLPKVCWVSEP
jgi:ammonia channel protein AmtB